MQIALAAYEDLRIRQLGGLSLMKLTVEKFFAEWIARKRLNFTASRAQWIESVFDRYMAGYFGKQNVSELTKKFADGYWEYRRNLWTSKEGQARIELNDKRIGAKSKSSHNVARQPAFNTLRAEASLINQWLRAAVDDGQLQRSIKISAQDAMAKSERGDGFRDTFTNHEWTVLTQNLYNYAHCRGKFADKRLHKLHRFQRRMLHFFVLLISSTGVRVSELKQIRWNDFDVRGFATAEPSLLVGIRTEVSKVRRQRVAVGHSDNIIKIMNDFKELCHEASRNDLVFFSEFRGEKRTVDLSVSFRKFLTRCPYDGRKDGLRFSHDGKPRTLTSLRHFYATQRLLQGVDVWQLATAMGTSVTQIRNHYGRHISGDAFIQELTKYKSKTSSQVKEKAVRQLVEMVQSGLLDEELALAQLKIVPTQKE